MDNSLTDIARKLRRQQTTAEAKVWRELRSRQVQGCKWRRQVPIDHYVVDFLCVEARMIVEIDGDVHYGNEERDAERQVYLESQGFRVFRVSNDDVFRNLDGVLQRIWELTG